MKITFLGDVALISENMESTYKPTTPYVFNLEYVNIQGLLEPKPIAGKINLSSSDTCFEKVFGSDPIAVNVVNNHIYDFGDSGFQNTLSDMSKKGILNVTDEPVFLNEKVCLFSYMLLKNNGYFQFDYEIAKKNIEMVRDKKADTRIVVQLHWGIEHHPSENAEQREVAHWLIENGVDLVIGHHPHCLQPAEEYKGKMIFYSLGNTLFGDISLPSHYDETLTATRTYRVKWQKWNRKSIAVIYDDEINRVVSIDALYQKGNKLTCVKRNIKKETLICKNERFSNMIYKLRKYYLFFVSNMFVDGKLFDINALKHELRGKI